MQQGILPLSISDETLPLRMAFPLHPVVRITFCPHEYRVEGRRAHLSEPLVSSPVARFFYARPITVSPLLFRHSATIRHS